MEPPRCCRHSDQVLPQELAALEQQVSEGHAVHGSEISFYWCFPFWVLAAQLQSKGIVVAGFSDFEVARSLTAVDRSGGFAATAL